MTQSDHVPSKSAAPAVPVRVLPISRKVKLAIAGMTSGTHKTITEAAEAVGLARESLSRALARPHVVEYMEKKVRRTLSMAAARAAHTKVDLLDSASERVRDSSSSFILGLAGIQPANNPSIAVNIEVKAGWVIDLSDDPTDPRNAKVVSPP